MKYCVYDELGQITKTGYAPESAMDVLTAAEGRILFMDDQSPVTDHAHYVDVDTLQVTAMPAKPSRFHKWDMAARAWAGDVGQVKAVKVKAIEAERDRRINEAIAYGTASVDADARAQGNLAGKLAAITQHEAASANMPPGQLVWRDADNKDHTFSSMAVYKQWLSGLAMAIDARGTTAYQWSWQRKAALAALDFDGAFAFDPLEN